MQLFLEKMPGEDLQCSNHFVNSFNHNFYLQFMFSEYEHLIRQTLEQRPRCQIDFWFKLYCKMKQYNPSYNPLNCSTFGLINYILLQNIEYLDDNNKINQMTQEEIDYIKGNRGAQFAILKNTYQPIYIKDAYNLMYRIDSNQCNNLFQD